MYMGSLTLLRLYTALQLMLLLTPPILNGLRAEPTLQFDVERQISKFYNLTSIKSYSLNDLNWTLISWKTMEDVVIIRGEWEAGTFEGYTSDSRLKNITLHMAAIAFLPVETEAQVGLICALHTEDHMLSVDHSIYIRLCREYGIPILLYGEKAEDWESMGYTGRNDLIHIGYYAAYLLNKDSAWNVLTGNFALALARTQSYAITLLQRICGKIGVKIDMVGFYGGSKEGYAQWFASTMDDRILISSPVGFQMENLTACIEYMFKQWGNYNPYLPEGKPQPIDLAPIYNFLTTTPQGRVVEQALSIARRMDKLKAEIYIIGGDVCGYNMHDGRNLLQPESLDVKTKDSLVLSLKDARILSRFTYDKGSKAFIVGGKHVGEVGEIEEIIVVRSSEPNMVRVRRLSDGETFETIEDYVFVVGEGKVEVPEVLKVAG